MWLPYTAAPDANLDRSLVQPYPCIQLKNHKEKAPVAWQPVLLFRASRTVFTNGVVMAMGICFDLEMRQFLLGSPLELVMLVNNG